MLEGVDLMHVNGEDEERGLIIIGSSTCEFFKASLDLMAELKAGYSYAILDKLEPGLRQETIKYLKEKYTDNLMCPFLLLGDGGFISGFNREVWLEHLKNPGSGGEGPDGKGADGRVKINSVVIPGLQGEVCRLQP